jgi:hypothetical protein
MFLMRGLRLTRSNKLCTASCTSRLRFISALYRNYRRNFRTFPGDIKSLDRRGRIHGRARHGSPCREGGAERRWALQVHELAPGVSAFNNSLIVFQEPSVRISDDCGRSFGSSSIVMFNLVGRLIGTWPRAIHSRSGDMAPMEVVPEITHSRVLCVLRFKSFSNTDLLHPLSHRLDLFGCFQAQDADHSAINGLPALGL